MNQKWNYYKYRNKVEGFHRKINRIEQSERGESETDIIIRDIMNKVIPDHPTNKKGG
jgi:hypothetical protein